MTDFIDLPLPGFGPADMATASTATIVAFPTRVAPEVIDLRKPNGPEFSSDSAKALHPSAPRNTPVVERRHRMHRPGSVGGVRVQAPMLDPTRHAQTEVRRRRRPTSTRSDGPPATIPSTSASRRRGPQPSAHAGARVRHPTNAPHPRVRERRNAVKRVGRAARVRAVVPALGVVLIAILAGIVAFFSPLFAVTDVRVDFAGTVEQRDQLASVTRKLQGKNLLRLDVDDSVRAISSLAWVNTVRVSRSLPHRVNVSVRAHDVAGVIKAPGGRWALTSTDGTVLMMVTTMDAALQRLPKIDVGLQVLPVPGDRLAESTPQVLSSARIFSQQMPGALQAVKVRNGDIQWTVQPDAKGSVAVHLGSADTAEMAASALTSVLRAEGPRPKSIDVSSPDTPVLTFS